MQEKNSHFYVMFRQLLIILAVLLVIYGVDRIGVMGSFKKWLESGVSGVNKVVDGGVYVLKTPVRTLTFWHGGVRRIADLEERLAMVAVDYVRMKELEEENETLKMVKGVSTKDLGEELILGRVAGVDGKLSVDVGLNDGVEEGAVVVDGQGVLIGRVGRVSVHRSEVLLPSDMSMNIPVRVVGEKSTGLVVGDGSQANLSEVLQAENLKSGDVLVTTGSDDKYPEGLVVGQVKSLSGDHADVTKGGVVELVAKYDNIVFVRKEVCE